MYIQNIFLGLETMGMHFVMHISGTFLGVGGMCACVVLTCYTQLHAHTCMRMCVYTVYICVYIHCIYVCMYVIHIRTQ